jgi:DNA-binding NtrC family response regulator
MTLAELERRYIQKILQKHCGNKKSAARELGISLRGLYYKLKIYSRK